MPVQKLVKTTKPRELIPNLPTEPRPKTCPRCAARRIHAIQPITGSGLAVWRCVACRAIGYGKHILNDDMTGEVDGAQSVSTAYRHDLL